MLTCVNLCSRMRPGWGPGEALMRPGWGQVPFKLFSLYIRNVKKKMWNRFTENVNRFTKNVTKRPGWNHETAIGWRSKKQKFSRSIFINRRYIMDILFDGNNTPGKFLVMHMNNQEILFNFPLCTIPLKQLQITIYSSTIHNVNAKCCERNLVCVSKITNHIGRER